MQTPLREPAASRTPACGPDALPCAGGLRGGLRLPPGLRPPPAASQSAPEPEPPAGEGRSPLRLFFPPLTSRLHGIPSNHVLCLTSAPDQPKPGPTTPVPQQKRVPAPPARSSPGRPGSLQGAGGGPGRPRARAARGRAPLPGLDSSPPPSAVGTPNVSIMSVHAAQTQRPRTARRVPVCSDHATACWPADRRGRGAWRRPGGCRARGDMPCRRQAETCRNEPCAHFGLSKPFWSQEGRAPRSHVKSWGQCQGEGAAPERLRRVLAQGWLCSVAH